MCNCIVTIREKSLESRELMKKTIFRSLIVVIQESYFLATEA